jgi:hypothetical protein
LFRLPVYAVWTQATPKDSNNLNIEFQNSDHDGRTWTKAVQLNDPQTGGLVDLPERPGQARPRLSQA